MTLEQFEQLVLSQKAPEPWTPVTDYSFEGRKKAEGDHARLILEVFEPKRLMDYGCGHGHLLRMLEEERPRYTHYFCGFEPNETLALQAQRYADVFDDIKGCRGGFDVVICREVMEHNTIREIRRLVGELCRLSAKFVYITTRFHPCPQTLLDVATSDDLDPTHISMLSQDFLRVLFVLEGFKRRADLEEWLDWQSKRRVLVYERAH